MVKGLNFWLTHNTKKMNFKKCSVKGTLFFCQFFFKHGKIRYQIEWQFVEVVRQFEEERRRNFF